MIQNEKALIPVSVITGFLGSGKTTLLNKLLKNPNMANTAIVINEFGEIGLDHDLVESSNDDIVLMSSGCLCCTIKGELIETLRTLNTRRLKSEIPKFSRLVIETTGLADPAPILHTLMADPILAKFYCLDGVISTVDAVNGEQTLDSQKESVKQVAVADRIIVTKTDVLESHYIEPLVARIKHLNPAAEIFFTVQGNIQPEKLFNCGIYNLENKSIDVRRWLNDESYGDGSTHNHHHDRTRHDDRIQAFSMFLEEPVSWKQLTTWFELLTTYRGEDLLRIKGILNVAESENPVAIHGVQHMFHPPIQLEAWPSDDHRSRLTFITRDLDQSVVKGMLEALTETESSQNNHDPN